MDGNGRRAAVIGGSLGGLTVANLLRDADWDVTVYERSSAPLDGRGAGIVVHDASVRYLVERTGLKLDQLSHPSSFIRYLHPSGALAHEQPSSLRFTSWNTLYRGLLSTIEVDYRPGHEVTNVTQVSDDEVHVHLATGHVEPAELVVAADGFDSTVRRIVCGHIAPTYGGYVGWRGLVSERDLTQETLEALTDAITYCVIPNSHIVAYPIPETYGPTQQGAQTVNYVWYRNVSKGRELEELMTGTDGHTRSVTLHPGLVDSSFVDQLRRDAEALAPPLTELVQRTDKPFVQAIFDIETTKMVSGNIALIGDGAFSARPHAAAGTAKAAEDGWRLIQELAAHDTISEALATWETSQLILGKQLVARARTLGKRSQQFNSWLPGDPELAFGLHGPGD